MLCMRTHSPHSPQGFGGVGMEPNSNPQQAKVMPLCAYIPALIFFMSDLFHVFLIFKLNKQKNNNVNISLSKCLFLCHNNEERKICIRGKSQKFAY